MTTDTTTGGPTDDAIADKNALVALKVAWGDYREWAAQSRSLKTELRRFSITTFTLTVTSAITGLLAGQIDELITIAGDSWLPKAFGLASAATIGLAGYFGKEILSPERERKWIQARSMAEACKSEAYRFATRTGVYVQDDANDQLLKKVRRLHRTVDGLWASPLEETEREKRLPVFPMDGVEYLKERVQDQINWYVDSANKNKRSVDIGRRISLILGAIGVLLGALSGFFDSQLPAAWIAVIGTITASIAMFLFSGRYQYLALSYGATAKKLRLEKSRWEISPEKTPGVLSAFVDVCENTFSLENKAWMAEWSDRSEEENTPNTPPHGDNDTPDAGHQEGKE